MINDKDTWNEFYTSQLNTPAGQFNQEMLEDEQGLDVLRSGCGTFVGLRIKPNAKDDKMGEVLMLTLDQATAAARMILEGIEEQMAKQRTEAGPIAEHMPSDGLPTGDPNVKPAVNDVASIPFKSIQHAMNVMARGGAIGVGQVVYVPLSCSCGRSGMAKITKLSSKRDHVRVDVQFLGDDR